MASAIISDSSNLYAPFFEQSSLPTSHTLRKGYYHNDYQQPTLKIERYHNSELEGIPVTDVDVIDKNGFLVYDVRRGTHYFPNPYYSGIPLHSFELYDTMVEDIKDAAIKKTEKFDPIKRTMTTAYTVSCSGHLVQHPPVFEINPSKPHPWEIPSYPLYPTVKHKSEHTWDDSKYNRLKHRPVVRYNGQLYDSTQYYRKSGANLVPISYPFGHGPLHTPIWQKCHIPRIDQTQRRTKCLIFKFHREQTFCGMRLHPEKMSFDSIHCNEQCKVRMCHKSKHCLKILKTDPGYVTAFEIEYRNDTIRDWISLGKFSGSTSESEIVDIAFDETVATEFKFTPIDFHKSFAKISCSFFSLGEVEQVDADDEVVYSITEPVDGKYFISGQSLFLDTFKVQKKSRHSKHRNSAHMKSYDRAKNRREIARHITETL